MHYRECLDDEKSEKMPLHSIVHYFLHKHIMPSYKSPMVVDNKTLGFVEPVRDTGVDTDSYLDEVFFRV